MNTTLYFLSESNKVSEVMPTSYDLESELQAIISKNPIILLRSYEKNDTELFLIKAEQPMTTDSPDDKTLSLDHLLVDSHGVPVLCEVKRSSNAQIYRKVVAQAMDYAARMRYLDVDDLREQFRSSQSEDVLAMYDTDEFWESVRTNLSAERAKIIFAADHIPGSLKTLIDFMNRMMPTLDIYGVEIQKYDSLHGSMLSSSIISDTSIIAKAKEDAASIKWDKESFREKIIEFGDLSATNAFDLLTNKLESMGYFWSYGIGSKYPSSCIWAGKYAVVRLGIQKKKISLSVPVTRLASILSVAPDTVRSWFDFDRFSSTPSISEWIVQNDNYILLNLRALQSTSYVDTFCGGIAQIMKYLSQNDSNLLTNQDTPI